VSRIGPAAIVLSLAGVAGILLTHGVIFFRVPTEATGGLLDHATALLVPMAWITVLAFGVAASAGAMYLWRGDDRADALALSAAEGGLYTGVATLIAGSLWSRAALGAFWTWEPWLTFTLVLWFMLAGYVLVRNSAKGPDHGKRLGAVVSVLGALNLPLILWSLYWFRGLGQESAGLPPEAPGIDFGFTALGVIALLAYTAVFAGLLALRYGVERGRRGRAMSRPATQGPP
jgi:heme exporter protein C